MALQSSPHRFRTFARGAFRPDGSDTLDRVAFVMLLVLIIAGPFAYGAILPAPLDAGAPAPLGRPLLDIFAFLTATAALLSRSAPLKMRLLRLPLGAAVGLTLLGVVQLLPLPEGVLRQFASVNIQIYHETGKTLSLFGYGEVPAPMISIAPWETVWALLGGLAAVSLFFATNSLARVRARRRALGWAVVASSGLQLGRLGVARAGGAGQTHPIGLDLAVATCLGLAFCVAFGMLWTEVLRIQERGFDSLDAGERFERRFTPIASFGILWVALAAAVVWVGVSTVTWSALAVAVILLILAATHRRQDIVRRMTASSVLAVLGLSLTRCAGAAAADPAASARHELLWNVSVAAWRRFPILGSGLGTFREAFRGVQPRDLRELVDQAPSGSIDLLVTGGLAGVLFGIIFFAALLTAFHRAWRLQIHREESATALAAIGALLLWLLLWTIDPAALRLVGSPLLAIILGAGWAAAQTSGGRIV